MADVLSFLAEHAICFVDQILSIALSTNNIADSSTFALFWRVCSTVVDRDHITGNRIEREGDNVMQMTYIR